ncbi:hypothetical protein E2C01_011391 [Portunus trituberculatus]|uniref:Uncharacterized protein n=1 Tax=Portunus trituberculatus TaxID=210409 RepID=A0A5B7DBK6_PORTR|nr:hypothetical protein [Portunus trituberculatus]
MERCINSINSREGKETPTIFIPSLPRGRPFSSGANGRRYELFFSSLDWRKDLTDAKENYLKYKT